MKRIYLLATCMAFPLWLCAQESQPSKTVSEAEQGESLFGRRCVVCHGSNGYGPPLSRSTVADESFARNQIENGGEHMPGFKYGLKPAQINSIVVYLKTVEPGKGMRK